MDKRKSFTLIELLVVIVIIGILAGVIMISTSSSIDKANFAKAQAFSSTVQNELLSNLVSEWTFNEPQEGNITKDSWANNHGTVVGATQVDDCVFGKCYIFNGSTNYIKIDSLVADLSNSLTFSGWFYPHSIVSSQKAILSFHTSTGQNLNMVFLRNTNVSYYDDSTNHIIASESISKDKWYFLTVTINSNGNGILYLNGKSVASFNTVVRPENGGKFSIGQEWDGATATDFFNGAIDDVRVYNSVLSSAQTEQNYIAGLDSLLYKNLISKEEYNQRIGKLANID
ncbi:MAG: LamG-like jellyroll fold domain-containing protein [Minisyncoccales bacterium]|jgi:prepilin-type N-terminal cleavage/methylation domain-containing protein